MFAQIYKVNYTFLYKTSYIECIKITISRAILLIHTSDRSSDRTKYSMMKLYKLLMILKLHIGVIWSTTPFLIYDSNL